MSHLPMCVPNKAVAKTIDDQAKNSNLTRRIKELEWNTHPAEDIEVDDTDHSKEMR